MPRPAGYTSSGRPPPEPRKRSLLCPHLAVEVGRVPTGVPKGLYGAPSSGPPPHGWWRRGRSGQVPNSSDRSATLFLWAWPFSDTRFGPPCRGSPCGCPSAYLVTTWGGQPQGLPLRKSPRCPKRATPYSFHPGSPRSPGRPDLVRLPPGPPPASRARRRGLIDRVTEQSTKSSAGNGRPAPVYYGVAVDTPPSPSPALRRNHEPRELRSSGRHD